MTFDEFIKLKQSQRDYEGLPDPKQDLSFQQFAGLPEDYESPAPQREDRSREIDNINARVKAATGGEVAPEMHNGVSKFVVNFPSQEKPRERTGGDWWGMVGGALDSTVSGADFNKRYVYPFTDKGRAEAADLERDQFLKKEKDQKSRDPNSMYSKIRRVQLKEALNNQIELGRKYGNRQIMSSAENMMADIDGMSGYEVDMLLGNRKGASFGDSFDDAYALQKLDLRERELDQRQRIKDRDFLAGQQARADRHPLVKDADKQIAGINNVRAIVSDAYNKGGQSLAAVGAKLAKALGEVGVLTDEDVTRYKRNPKWTAAMVGAARSAISGKLTYEDARNIMRLMDIIEEEAVSARDVGYNRVAGQYSVAEGIDEEEAKKRLNPNNYGQAPKKPGKEDQAALDWLKANPKHKAAAAVRKKLQDKGLLK